MKTVQKYEMIPPKTGETNRLFGLKYLKRHKMRDIRWTADDKILQYVGMTRLYERDHQLSKLNAELEIAKAQKYLKQLKLEVKQQTTQLRLAEQGDHQKLKNVLSHDKSLQRCLTNLNPQELDERVDEITFQKQGQLDKLKFTNEELTKEYEKRLLQVAKLQDRIKYEESIEPKENEDIRRLSSEIKNSETRRRAMETVTRAYKKIIDLFLQDSIYYDSVLDALKEDLEEQDSFIKKAILLGKPVVEAVAKLQRQYHENQRRAKEQAARRLSDLMKQREKIQGHNKQLYNLVRRDDDFEMDPTRYNRDTPHITELKLELDALEPIMHELKLATKACKPEEVIPKMQQLGRKDERVLNQIGRLEKEEAVSEVGIEHASVVRETLQYSLTDEEIEQLANIEGMKIEIEEEFNKQKESEKETVSIEKQLMTLRVAFQHVNDVLKEIGRPLGSSKKVPGSALALPLLKFSTVLNKPPPPFEDDLATLLSSATSKIEVVVNKFKTELEKEKTEDNSFWDTKLKEAKGEEEIELIKKLKNKVHREESIHKWKDYPLAIQGNSTKQFTKPHADSSLLVDHFVREDPNIPTRNKIKEESAKIVTKMSKVED